MSWCEDVAAAIRDVNTNRLPGPRSVFRGASVGVPFFVTPASSPLEFFISSVM